MPPEGKQRWCLDRPEYLPRVMSQDGPGLAEEGIHWRHRAAPHELGEGVMYSGRAAYSSGVKHQGNMP